MRNVNLTEHLACAHQGTGKRDRYPSTCAFEFLGMRPKDQKKAYVLLKSRDPLPLPQRSHVLCGSGAGLESVRGVRAPGSRMEAMVIAIWARAAAAEGAR